MRVCIIAGGLALFVGWAAHADMMDGKKAFQAGQYDVALKELSASAKHGDPEAFLMLGRMYAAGLGVRRNQKTAVEYYRKGAVAGYPPAQKEYGTALTIGDGVKQDVNEGLKWLLIAARLGNQEAGKYASRLAGVIPERAMITARIEASKWLRAHKRDDTPEQLK